MLESIQGITLTNCSLCSSPWIATGSWSLVWSSSEGRAKRTSLGNTRFSASHRKRNSASGSGRQERITRGEWREAAKASEAVPARTSGQNGKSEGQWRSRCLGCCWICKMSWVSGADWTRTQRAPVGRSRTVLAICPERIRQAPDFLQRQLQGRWPRSLEWVQRQGSL